MDLTIKKRPFGSGVANIVRFNWPFYFFACAAIAVLSVVFSLTTESWFLLLAILVSLPVACSLIAALWIYDCSTLYQLPFIEFQPNSSGKTVISVTAGLDEVSSTLRERFPGAQLRLLDFYDDQKHGEPSIRRARCCYSLPPETEIIDTNKALPVACSSVSLIIGFLSLHEIRDENERVAFLQELAAALAPEGRLIVVEHVRDLPNALAFTLGVFHFHLRRSWLENFDSAGLTLTGETKITPLIRIFTLQKSCRP